MPFRASEFEFRHRFFVVGFCFFLAFLSYRFDPRNAAQALGGRIAPHAPERVASAIFVLGALVATASAALRTWASAYLSGAVVHDTDLHSDRLEADGPYRHVRNPLYLGMVMLAFGQGWLASRVGFLFLLPAVGVVSWRLVAREEHELATGLGAPYLAYAARVPRFWPALSPRLPRSGRRPRWGQALAAEAFFWIFAAGTWVFVVSRDLGRFGLFCLLGGLVYWPIALVLKHRAGRGAPS